MSTRPLKSADDNQRRAADPAHSVFVTANAGSGKTKVLVDRIARLLLEGSKPSAFLCITYTKAAAAEMQRRLFERLGGWCVADDSKLAEDLKKLGVVSPDLGRARALFAQALETPGGLKIQTIHAFCERLLARFPLEAGVPPGFDIADDARSALLLGQARADAALAEDAPADAFRRFAAKLSGDQLDMLLDRLALRRADFHRFAQKHKGQVFAEAELKNRHRVRQSAEAFAASFVAGVDWNGLRQAAEALNRSTVNNQKTGQRINRAVDAHGSGAAARAVLECVLRIALKEDGEPYGALATATLLREEPWLARVLDPLANGAAEARETLNAIDRADDAKAALALALMLDRGYQRAKQRAGVLDFDDLIEHAQKLLGQSAAAPWVLYKLDGGLDHILIDEGQDTSPAQWDLIAPLQDEFFAGAGARTRRRTVFAVGDPKQSIYGFQGADPERFLRENQTLSKRAHKAKQSFVAPMLETSFRSTPEVLRAVDETFADKELIAPIPEKFDVVRHLAAREAEHGVVEVWPLAVRPVAQPAQPWDAPVDVETGSSVHAILARRIAIRVREMIAAGEAVWENKAKREMRAGDVLALVRTRGALFRELIKAFKREGLPVAGADRMTLRDELAVEDCLALMRVALDPADDLALACVLKGPWCNLDDDDADIFPLAYDRGRETLMSRLLANAETKYAPARAFVGELAARAGTDAFAFLSWALETNHAGGLSGWARVFARLGAETRDPLEELLQRALKPSAHVAPTLQRFLCDIELDASQVKRELEAETGAIRVMTVHGAKGLEAPVVILPDCTGEVADKPEEGLIFNGEDGPFYSRRLSDDDVAARDARAAYKQRMLGEHWRLLYVAMTRARDRLIVCGAQHGNSKAGEAELCWRQAVEEALRRIGAETCETPFGKGVRIGAPLTADAQTHAVATAPAVPAWAHTPAPGAVRVDIAAPSRIARVDPALFSPRGDGQRRFRRGRLIHGLLQRLPDVAVERREEAGRAWLARQGVAAAEADAFVREALAVIGDARFAAVFGPQSRAEAPIVGTVAGKSVRGVVDRLVVEDDRVVVLDFKTDRPAPKDAAKTADAYVLQLALYREVLRAIFPGRSVACALLWTEAPLLMDVPDARLDAVFEAYRRG